MTIKDMPIGTRFYENASCKIRFCVAIPNQLRSKTREVVSLDVPTNLRRRGMAKELMIDVCDEADACKILLVLFPEPFGTDPKMSQKQLIDWYGKFEFQVVQVEPKVMMVRMPCTDLIPSQLNYVNQIIYRNIL